MAGGHDHRGVGRQVVIVLMLLCAACGAWIAVSLYRQSAIERTLSLSESQLRESLPLAVEIVKLKGRRDPLPPLSESDLDALIINVLQGGNLKWLSIIPIPPRKTGNVLEYSRTIQVAENNISTIIQFLVALKAQRPDLVIERINFNSVGRSKDLWSGTFEIQMIQKAG